MRLRKPIFSVLTLAVALRLAWAVDIDPQQYLENIRILASDQMKGRATGTPELDKAAEYIAEQFRSFGLKPPPGNGYLQSFEVTVSAQPGAANRFEYAEGTKKTSLRFDEEFRPLSFSSAGVVSGQVVFAGYGITAREYGYDDYAGVDARNKLVLILRHEPQEFDDESVFGGKTYTNHAQYESKAVNARRHGASAVILAGDSPSHRGNRDELEAFSQTVGPGDLGIPFVEVKAEVAERWLGSTGRSLERIVKGINNT